MLFHSRLDFSFPENSSKNSLECRSVNNVTMKKVAKKSFLMRRIITFQRRSYGNFFLTTPSSALGCPATDSVNIPSGHTASKVMVMRSNRIHCFHVRRSIGAKNRNTFPYHYARIVADKSSALLGHYLFVDYFIYLITFTTVY